MTSYLRHALLLWSLTACGGTWGFGGQDIGNENNPDDSANQDVDSAAPTVSVLDAECGDSGVDGGLDLQSTSAGRIDVVDATWTWDCCAEWEVSATAADSTLTVAYDDVDDQECDCECDWVLTYALEGIDAGTWTVVVPSGESAQVTVE